MSTNRTGAMVLGAGVVALGGALAWLLLREPAKAPAQARPPFMVPVTLASVERGTLQREVLLSGRVQVLQRARMAFDVVGRLAEVAVREGDRVPAGALLARLDPREREALLQVAQAAEQRTRRELVLLESPARPEELQRLEAVLEGAASDLGWTTSEERRMAALVEGGGVPRSAYESMAAQRRASESRHAAARAALDMARAGARPEEVEVQRARVAEAAAHVARAQVDLDRTRLLAPFEAQVAQRLLAPGDAVQPGLPVLEVVDARSREVAVDVPAHHAADLQPGARVVLTLDERPEWSLEAAVASVVADADPRSGAQRALVRLSATQDAEGVLVPGSFVRARVELRPLVDVLLVPGDAVRRTLEGWVLVKAVPPAAASAEAPPAPAGRPSGLPPLASAAFVPVRLLGQARGRAAVQPLGVALEPAERIVVVGADLAFPGAPLLERPAVPAAGAGVATEAGAAPAGKDAK